MGLLVIPHYKGGQALDLFDPISKGTFQTSKDLDIYKEGNLLRPHKRKFQAITLPTITGGSSITVANSFKASNGKTYVLGSAVISSTLNIVLWSTGTIESSPTWTADYNVGSGSPGTVMDEYKDGLFFGYGTNLDRWGDLSGSPSRTSISTGLDSVPLFIRAHKGLGKLYIVHGKKIASYNNTTVTLAALTVEQSDTIVGIEPLGRFMIVGVRAAGSGRSRFLVWDGTNTTLDDTIDLGEVALQGFRIVNGTIEFVCQTFGVAAGFDFIRLMEVRPGSTPKLIQEKPYSVTTGSGTMDVNAFSNFGDLFLYAFKGSTYDIDLGIYAYGSGSEKTSKVPAFLRLVSDGTTSTVSVTSIQHNGDNIILIWSTLVGSGTYHIDGIGGNLTNATPSTGVYQSNAFPLNKGKLGKIKRIILLHKNLPSSCGFTLKIKHFGHYPVTGSVASADSFVAITTPQGTGSSTGKTQSTNDAAYTIVEDADKFKEARFAQIEIDWDEVNSTDAAEILFPIFIETVDTVDEF